MELTMEQYGKYIKNAAPHLSAGAFLTTKSSGRVNTMTIGWGTFGFQWGMPTFEAMVRKSRFSKAAMDSEETFTVTIPYGTDMREALSYCGKISGRDEDKISKAGLTPVEDNGRVYFEEVRMAFVCRKLYAQEMQEGCLLDDDSKAKWYPDKDYHTLYIAEIEKLLIKG